MAAATGRFIQFSVVRVSFAGPPLSHTRLPPARGLAVPSRAEAPARTKQLEDWADIEAMLTLRHAHQEAIRKRPRRHALPVMVSSVAVSAAFAGLVMAALYASSPTSCSPISASCTVKTAKASPVVKGPAAIPASHSPKSDLAVSSPAEPRAPAALSAQVETPQQPIVQGRSVSEEDTNRPASAPDASEPVSLEPTHHKRHHRHRR